MAQASSPSMPLSDGQAPSHSASKSNSDVPIDPSIAQSSPTYPNNYSPYGPPPHDMSQYPPQHPGYPTHWSAGYGPPHGMPYSSPGAPGSTAGSPATAGPPRPGQQVYSFVPIPGAQQHKRPRRRYEEIERMYKCGHNGCEKAYGTLNHLNAHVTMQSHGSKRTPEEFKEIRKEWKARKKEEENARKAEDDRARTSMGGQGVDGNVTDGSAQTPTSAQYSSGVRQLPPIGYPAPGGPVQGGYPASSEGMSAYPNGQPVSGYSTYPAPPYTHGAQMGYPQQHSEGHGNYGAQ
ncbi:MAG: hypothetical protein MMC23_001925 [Stictis urceolatum]|nr:hypothetical protein [Stictis urceolata]